MAAKTIGVPLLSAWFILVGALARCQEPVALTVPGLEGAHANRLLQDKLGALWIGTDRGLLRFDGAGTEHYVSEPMKPQTLPHDNILDLLLDDDGTLWVATSGGMLALHTRTGAQRRLRFLRDDHAVDLQPMHLAPSAHGHWAFCGSAGVYKWSPGDSLYRPVKTPGTPALVRAGGGWEAPDGSLWYVDRMAVRHWMPKEQREEVFPCAPFGSEAPPKTLMLDVQPDRYDPDRLWIEGWGVGFVSFDMRTHAFTPHVVQRELNDLVNVVRSAAQTSASSWQVVIDDALYALHTVGDSSGLRPLRSSAITRTVLRTARGDLFLGGFGKVWAVPPTAHDATPMRHALAMSNTHAFGAREGDGYWAVHFYAERRLMRLDADGRELFSIAFPADTLPYEAFRLVQVRNGDLWLGTTRGLMRCRAGTRVIEPVVLNDARYPDRRIPITDLIVDEEDRLWAVLERASIVCIDGTTGEQRMAQLDDGARSNDLCGLNDFGNGQLLVSASGHYPFLLDVHTLKPAPFIHPDVPEAAFANVEGAVMQADGKPIFYSYNQGLVRFHDPDGDARWTVDRSWQPTERPGFSDAVRDTRGRIWFATDRGALLLDPATDVLAALDPLHGVHGMLYEQLALLPNGDVLACGTPHFRFGKAYEPEQREAPLVLRKVLAGGIDRTAPAIADSSITLQPGSANVSLGFGRVALLEGDAFSYAYRLVHDGDEGPWIELGRERSVSIAGLEAGAYRIELRSLGTPAIPATIFLELRVVPYWWATWWFRLIMLVLAMAIGVLATRQILALRYRRKLREVERQRELEKVRMRIARDVHDGIGSGLTKITMMLRNVPGADPAQAQRIAKASSELVHELGEIVWTVDPRNDDVASFVAFVRSTLGRQAEGLPIELVSKLSFDPAMAEYALPPDVKRNVLLVMREAVNNALKHSGGDRVEVELAIDAHGLVLTVRDNGQGFDVAQARVGGNGLHNFRKRAEEIGGLVVIASSASGTSITLTVRAISTNVGIPRR